MIPIVLLASLFTGCTIAPANGSSSDASGWKPIVINENDSHMHSQRSDVYPMGLIKLMELVNTTSKEQMSVFQESEQQLSGLRTL